MKYSLVIQFPAASIQDYDALIEIEDALRERLPNSCRVDGHDCGSGEMNLFIHTDNPPATFLAIQNLLGTKDYWPDARVAYRETHGNRYTTLWPEDLREFRIT